MTFKFQDDFETTLLEETVSKYVDHLHQLFSEGYYSDAQLVATRLQQLSRVHSSVE